MPDIYAKDPAKAALLAKQRNELQRQLKAAETEWLDLSAEMEEATG